MIDSRRALTAQITAIIGCEPASSYVELRAFAPGVDAWRQFVPIHQAARRVPELLDELADRDVFIGVAPRVREGGTAADVERVWCLWADCDSAASMDALRAIRPLPAIVLRSGSGGAHGYWPLENPLTGELAHRGNRRLALALGSDMVSTDAARILRVAGSSNHKRSEPVPVVCTRAEPVLTSAREVVGGLPDSHHYDPPRAISAKHEQALRESDPDRVLGGLIRVVSSATQGTRNHSLFWSACRVCDHAGEGQLDEGYALDRLRDAALENGLGEAEIAATLRSARSTRSRAAA
jgi:hypothetical protein